MSAAIMTEFSTGNDFGIAVSKYLGLEPSRVSRVALKSDLNEALTISIDYVVTGSDLVAIGESMQVADVSQISEPAHPLRAEFDSMMPHQQAHFGSFDAYVAMHEKLDAPEPEIQVKWIAAADLTEDQIKGAMGEHNGTYAVNVDDLTDEQRTLP